MISFFVPPLFLKIKKTKKEGIPLRFVSYAGQEGRIGRGNWECGMRNSKKRWEDQEIPLRCANFAGQVREDRKGELGMWKVEFEGHWKIGRIGDREGGLVQRN